MAQKISANKTTKKKESFTYFAPTAENVMLAGDFTDWEQHPITLKKSKTGTWTATVPLEPGMHEYRFLVDGQWRDDAECSLRRPNAFGEQNCVREVK
jgi:1,4-alpha-glucan branching enzyme